MILYPSSILATVPGCNASCHTNLTKDWRTVTQPGWLAICEKYFFKPAHRSPHLILFAGCHYPLICLHPTILILFLLQKEVSVSMFEPRGWSPEDLSLYLSFAHSSCGISHQFSSSSLWSKFPSSALFFLNMARTLLFVDFSAEVL